MRIGWNDLGRWRADAAQDAAVEIEGWMSTAAPCAAAEYFLLSPEPVCCWSCLPRDPLACVEVFAAAPVPLDGRKRRLAGRWRVLEDDAAGWRYQLRDARVLPAAPAAAAALSRRGVLAAAPLLTLAACAAGPATPAPPGSTPDPSPERLAEARAIIAGSTTIDVHSHAGGLIGVRRVEGNLPFVPLAEPMRQGGLGVVCLAIVSDSPTHRVMPDHRIHAYREPAPGELHAYAQRNFARARALAADQGLAVVSDAEGLRAAGAGRPSVIIAAEGGDFLEGDPDRIDEAYERWQLRHLQLTHYRVNELGDIQTEAPVHDGLTEAGAAAIRRCNRRGLVVDVAHGTYALVKRAAEVTTKALVLSHTSLTDRPGRRSRQISADHARLVAGTGGVIGVWPPVGIFPDLPAMAAGMARLAEVVGVDHVALGSDMMGLVGASAFDSYARLPELAAALRGVGFDVAETGRILGGNYARVFAQSLA